MGSETGRGAALLIAVGHGVCSPALFNYAYMLYRAIHRRLVCVGRGGLSSPLLVGLLILLLAVNMGVPPFVNLWREVMIFVALLPQ